MKKLATLFAVLLYSQLQFAQNSSFSELSVKAKASFDAKEWDKAIALCKEAIPLKPQERSIYNLLLNSNYMKLTGDFTKEQKRDYIITEINDFSKLVNRNPKAGLGYSVRSVMYTWILQWQDAVNDLSVAIRLSPDDTIFYYKRAILYQDKFYFSTKSDSAMADWNKLVSMGSKNPEVFMRRGDIFEYNGQFTQALDDYTKAIQLVPGKKGLALIYSRRAGLYAWKELNDKAIADYDMAIALDEFPENTSKYVDLKKELSLKMSGVVTLASLDFYTSGYGPDYSVTKSFYAEHDYQKLLDRGLEYTYRGYGAKKEVSFKKAIVCYTEAIRLYPNVYNAYYYRAFVYKKDGDISLAKKDIEKAKTVDPSVIAMIDKDTYDWEVHTTTYMDQPSSGSTNNTYPNSNQPSTEKKDCVCSFCSGTGTMRIKSLEVYYPDVVKDGRVVGRSSYSKTRTIYEDLTCTRCLGTGKCK